MGSPSSNSGVIMRYIIEDEYEQDEIPTERYSDDCLIEIENEFYQTTESAPGSYSARPNPISDLRWSLRWVEDSMAWALELILGLARRLGRRPWPLPEIRRKYRP